MKKYFIFLLMALFAIQFQSCSNDDDSKEQISELEKNYLSIENAVYNKGNIPAATTDEKIDGIDMSNQVMNGAMNYISIVTEKNIKKFFVGIKGVNGYFEYVPQSEQTSMASSSEYNTYVIPVMLSQSYTGNTTLILSGQLDNGDITAPVENEMFYIETMPGAIEVKLAFSNSKDVDLHLYTPSGEHIYYGNRGGAYHTEDGSEITYGLDVDSNAGCNIDNINKENIYIPAELVENGIYTVIVDMYENCQPAIATNWSIVARYQGDLITPTQGVNPASGVYPVGAGKGDHTTVMTFTINDGTRSATSSKLKLQNFQPTKLTKLDKMKLERVSAK
ncbi:hypothetical protein [Prevotella sp.]|jgi:hypothetical protein|uniref:hypothetical protein n=1 Tax=Prevotella sp. TaxID=59823 RepID=UPI0025EB4EA6|nr:hypothetical protein [Prevotella sp.]